MLLNSINPRWSYTKKWIGQRAHGRIGIWVWCYQRAYEQLRNRIELAGLFGCKKEEIRNHDGMFGIEKANGARLIDANVLKKCYEGHNGMDDKADYTSIRKVIDLQPTVCDLRAIWLDAYQRGYQDGRTDKCVENE